MAGAGNYTAEQIKAMAQAFHLDIPEERMEMAVKMYAHFDEGFVKIRAIQTGALEPTTLKPEARL